MQTVESQGTPRLRLSEALGMTEGVGRVLVVDDDLDTLEVTVAVLAEEGCDVRSAAHGEEALAILAEEPVDLILLDLVMPVMNGVAFVRQYQATPGPHAPIVVLTASFHSEEIVDELGVAGRLDKPFDLDALLAAVSQFSPCVEPPEPT